MEKKFSSLSKYKKLTLIYPFIHIVGFLLTVLIAKGKNETEVLFGHFLIYTILIIGTVLLIEILLKKFVYLNSFITKDFFAIAIVLLVTTIILTVASNFDVNMVNDGIIGGKRQIRCVQLYMFTSLCFCIYIRVMRLIEKEDEEEELN